MVGLLFHLISTQEITCDYYNYMKRMAVVARMVIYKSFRDDYETVQRSCEAYLDGHD